MTIENGPSISHVRDILYTLTVPHHQIIDLLGQRMASMIDTQTRSSQPISCKTSTDEILKIAKNAREAKVVELADYVRSPGNENEFVAIKLQSGKIIHPGTKFLIDHEIFSVTGFMKVDNLVFACMSDLHDSNTRNSLLEELVSSNPYINFATARKIISYGDKQIKIIPDALDEQSFINLENTCTPTISPSSIILQSGTTIKIYESYKIEHTGSKHPFTVEFFSIRSDQQKPVIIAHMVSQNRLATTGVPVNELICYPRANGMLQFPHESA